MKAMRSGPWRRRLTGYISKLIDTQTLGRRIREVVERRTRLEPTGPVAPPPVPAISLPGAMTLSGLEIESIRRRFLEEGVLQSRQLLMDLNASFDVASAASLVHKWIGAGGALGYTDISAYAQIVAGLLENI